jgi:hypothetical protein
MFSNNVQYDQDVAHDYENYAELKCVTDYRNHGEGSSLTRISYSAL